MQEKILTISIAAYNVERYLKKTLDSLVIDAAHMNSLEIIIVNDGSKDTTPLIAREYVQQYPDTFRLIDKDNGGYGSTINASLLEAKGKYYKLLDGDDWYESEVLSGLLDYLACNEVDLVISPYYTVFTEKTEVSHYPGVPEKITELEEILAEENPVQMHGLIVRTEVLRAFNHSIATHCFYTDSEYVFYCIAAAQSIVRYNSAVYCYRLGENGQSMSKEGLQKHYKDQLLVTERLCESYEKDCQEFKRGKKDLVDRMVTTSFYCAFNYCMLLNDAKNHKNELRLYDAQLREKYPNAYSLGDRSRVIKMLRKFNFRCYGLFCRYMRYKFDKLRRS